MGKMLGEGRRRAELVDAKNEEGFRDMELKSEGARFPFAPGLTFRIRIAAECLSLTANLPGSQLHPAGFAGVPRCVVRARVRPPGSSRKENDHHSHGGDPDTEQTTKKRIGVYHCSAQLF